jgi:phage terminase large subunit GpA-like protein
MSLRLPPAEYHKLCLKVFRRDKWRCRNPRCGMRNGLHVHHILFRSENGPDESWNLVAICRECHDLIHGYQLFIWVAEGNWVGHGGGADGKLIFQEE